MISWVRDCRDEYVSTTDTNGTKDEDGLAAIWKLINSLPLKGSSWEIRRDWTMALIIVSVVRVRATLAKRCNEKFGTSYEEAGRGVINNLIELTSLLGWDEGMELGDSEGFVEGCSFI
jgi:hypothetical protein